MDRIEKKRTEIQSYLKERVNPILEPLTVAIIKSRPEDIVDFCVNWLKTFSKFLLIKTKKHQPKTRIQLNLKKKMTLLNRWFSKKREEVWSKEIDLQFQLKYMDSLTNNLPSFPK